MLGARAGNSRRFERGASRGGRRHDCIIDDALAGRWVWLEVRSASP